MTVVLRLPRELRPELRRPWGTLYPRPSVKTYRRLHEDSEALITVGDMTTRSFLRCGIRPDVAVVDRKMLRTVPVDPGNKFPITLNVNNPPGTITKEAWETVRQGIEYALDGDATLIDVTGEEDLLAIPAILVAPENSIVCYGLPGEGMVAARITRHLKDSVLRLLTRFRGYDEWKSRSWISGITHYCTAKR
ncbi:GTP-dependent dephospho-CoA kinase family protein [Methanopyrus sp. KOL6]|uniref:GTP-dependent dephospho-CoA kinase family protein n=1 Tax=Methanopyrus sp. KOL6 TaxID=1937004 RepID=UPI000B4C20D2|nr:GTP-dependent dephospho-CoA kinase family protein [Methanopyrus sp. KOL6]